MEKNSSTFLGTKDHTEYFVVDTALSGQYRPCCLRRRAQGRRAHGHTHGSWSSARFGRQPWRAEKIEQVPPVHTYLARVFRPVPLRNANRNSSLSSTLLHGLDAAEALPCSIRARVSCAIHTGAAYNANGSSRTMDTYGAAAELARFACSGGCGASSMATGGGAGDA